MAPLCFVLMPFGQKPDSTGAIIDFDRVYTDLMAPAISAAGLGQRPEIRAPQSDLWVRWSSSSRDGIRRP
jgi:hypothetical protein